jgi:hypothetical protein
MRTPCLLIALPLLAFCLPARAVDYSKLDRTIAKEPAYQKSPKYALLLFGNEARLRVWLVLDGDTVYLDRNADGDLTAKDEHFARKEDCRDVEIPDPDRRTRYVIKYVSTFTDKKDNREFLDVDVEIKGPLSYAQYCGVELTGHPREAKVAHFNGPLTMGPITINWKLPADLALVTGDTPTDLRGHVGTMSAEHGCWVVVRSHHGDASAFPPGVCPVVDVEFPPKAPGGPTVKKRYKLDKFC